MFMFKKIKAKKNSLWKTELACYRAFGEMQFWPSYGHLDGTYCFNIEPHETAISWMGDRENLEHYIDLGKLQKMRSINQSVRCKSIGFATVGFATIGFPTVGLVTVGLAVFRFCLGVHFPIIVPNLKLIMRFFRCVGRGRFLCLFIVENIFCFEQTFWWLDFRFSHPFFLKNKWFHKKLINNQKKK